MDNLLYGYEIYRYEIYQNKQHNTIKKQIMYENFGNFAQYFAKNLEKFQLTKAEVSSIMEMFGEVISQDMINTHIDGVPLLHYAISNGAFCAIPLLIENGADLSKTSSGFDSRGNAIYENWTALDLATNLIPNTFPGKKAILSSLTK